jgi:transcriptional regulator with XRE-family HTH domain
LPRSGFRGRNKEVQMPEQSPPPMAEIIQARLERMDLSAAEASRRAGLPEDGIDRILAGRAPVPRGSRLVRLAEVLECSVSYLVGLDPDVMPPAEFLEEDQKSFGLLAADQEALLSAYGRLDLQSKQALLRVAQKMAGPEPEPAPAPRRSRVKKG